MIRNERSASAATSAFPAGTDMFLYEATKVDHTLLAVWQVHAKPTGSLLPDGGSEAVARAIALAQLAADDAVFAPDLEPPPHPASAITSTAAAAVAHRPCRTDRSKCRVIAPAFPLSAPTPDTSPPPVPPPVPTPAVSARP